MLRSSLIIFLLVYAATAFAGKINSLPQHDAQYYDSLTYADYLDGNWKALLQHSSEAKKHAASSLFILKREGYAYYNRQDYFNAIADYDQVLKKDPWDTDAIAIMGLSYMNTGRTAQLNRLSSKMDSSLMEYLLLPKRKPVESIYLESSVALSNNIDKNARQNLLGSERLFGLQNLDNNLYYWQAGIKLTPLPKVSFYIAYHGLWLEQVQRQSATALHITGTSQAVFNGVPYQQNNYSLDDTTARLRTHVLQHQAYANAVVALPRDWIMTFYGHGLFYSYGELKSSYQVQSYLAQPIDYIPSYKTVYSFSKGTHTGIDYLGGLAITKQVRQVLFDLSGSYSHLNGLQQEQASGALVYYPFGNTRFSLAPRVTYFHESSTNRIIEQLDINVKLHKYLWVTVFGTYGDLSRTNELYGNVVFNNADKMIWRAGATLFMPVQQHVHIYLNYQFRQQQSAYYTYTDATNASTYKTTYLNYQNHFITLGLKFNL